MKKAVMTGVWVGLIVLAGCMTANQQQKAVAERLTRIAHHAAFIGTKSTLMNQPEMRPAFALAVASLAELEAAHNTDPAALAGALQALNVREFKGDDGALLIEGALLLYDDVLGSMTRLSQGQVVGQVTIAIRMGMERALK